MLSKEGFEASYEKMVSVVNEPGDRRYTKLKIFGWSRQCIPTVLSPRTMQIKAQRAATKWPSQSAEGLHLREDPEDCVVELEGAFVIGMGGIVVDVTVCAWS